MQQFKMQLISSTLSAQATTLAGSFPLGDLTASKEHL